MTWQQIKARTLATRVRGDRVQRTLVTWKTDAGDMFAHGMLGSGPERDDSPEAEPGDTDMYFYMKYETRRDRLDRWKWLPKVTHGFRPTGTEQYLIGSDLGMTGSDVCYFRVPTGRKNQLRFYVPSRDVPGEEYDLTWMEPMLQAMVDGGWSTRYQWAHEIRQGLDYYSLQGRLQHDMPITDLVDGDVLNDVRSIMSNLLPELTELRVAKSDNLMHRKSWLQQFGLVTHIDKLSVYDFQELVGDFCMSLYTVAGRNRYQGEEPLHPEEYDYLQRVLQDMNEVRRGREKEVMDKAVAERTGDDAWAKVIAERMHMARGNLIEDFNKAMKVEPEEVVRHPSDYQQARNSIDAGVQVLS